MCLRNVSFEKNRYVGYMDKFDKVLNYFTLVNFRTAKFLHGCYNISSSPCVSYFRIFRIIQLEKILKCFVVYTREQ